MKIGYSGGNILADIAQGATRETIRERYQRGDYGNENERFAPRYVDAALKWYGR